MGPWSASLFGRYFGPRPLTEDNSVHSSSSTLFNAQATYRWDKRLRFSLDVFNVFDRQAVMRHWNELGTFDLLSATKSLDTAAKVHDCLGTLLADLITEALSGHTADPPKEPAKQ